MSSARLSFSPENNQMQSALDEGVTYETRTITPEFAAFLLNRSIEKIETNQAAVNAYGQTMLAGAWIENGNAILLDENDRLIDGRKRLEAAVKFGCSFKTLITKGLKRDIVHTLDQHRRRSYPSVLEARGIAHSASVARLMTKLIRIDDGTFGKISPRISWARYDEVFEKNEGLIEAVAISEEAFGCPLHSTARPVVAFIGEASGMGKSVRDLFSGISNHEDLSRGHPAKELSLQLTFERKRGIRNGVDDMIVMGLQALKDLHEGNENVEPYGWVRDWGDCSLKSDNMPSTPREAIEDAPRNLGFEPPATYSGIHAGRESMIAGGKGLERLKVAADHKTTMGLYEYRLTPDTAQAWLSRFNKSNRKIQMSHVKSIARDIRGGNWMRNAQPVCFNGNPFEGDALLLNGQHRLSACVESGEEIEILVATDLPKAAFETYDVQSKRSHRSMHKGDERVINSAALMLWRQDQGLSPLARDRASASEILATVEKHEDIYPAFQMSRKKEMQEIASAGILTFFIAHIRKENEDIAERFLDQLMHGEGLERGNPISNLRALLIGRRSQIKRRDVLQALLDCWNEYNANSVETVASMELV